jgi:hypothetical protein
MQDLCAGTSPLTTTSEALRSRSETAPACPSSEWTGVSDKLPWPASAGISLPSRDCRRTIAALMIKKDIRGAFMTEPSYEELKARLVDLEKQVEAKKRSGAIDFRVSEKGGVSVYGLGRFPVTLYYEQWTRLLDAVPDLKVFIEENKSKLKLKQG